MIEAIETAYNGHRFRSRTEARWAVFFDALAIRYTYEMEGFDLGNNVRYLPDFWLPQERYWFEVKGERPDLLACEKAQRLANGSGHPVVIWWGSIAPEFSEHANYLFVPNIDMPQQSILWFDRKQHITALGQSPDDQPHYDLHTTIPVYPPSDNDPATNPALFKTAALIAAYEAARQARFEHGQAPNIPLDGLDKPAIHLPQRIDTLWNPHSANIEQPSSEFPHRRTGIPTGLEVFDKVFGGLNEGDLIVVAGEVDTGKSILVQHWATRAALNVDATTLFFSAELLWPTFRDRLIAWFTGVDPMSTGAKHADISAFNGILQMPLWFDTLSEVKINEFYQRIKTFHAVTPIHLMIIDGLYGLEGHVWRNRDVPLLLKRLALELSIPVVVTIGIKGAMGEVPTLKRIEDAPGAPDNLTQVADSIFGIWHPDLPIGDSDSYGETSKYPNVVEVRCLRNRHAPLISIPLRIRKKTYLIADLSEYRNPDNPTSEAPTVPPLPESQ